MIKLPEMEQTPPDFQNDHNVYILGAGFSSEAGYPLVHNFMDKMREAALTKQGLERRELEAVLRFRKEASAAAYRTTFDPENIEDLFSLAAATENLSTRSDLTIAIAETLIYCKNSVFDRIERFESSFLNDSESIEGFERNNVTGQNRYPLIDRYKLYTGIMAGKWGGTPLELNSFITFNYDMVLEEAFQMWNLPFKYEGLIKPATDTLRALGLGYDLNYHELPNLFVTDPNQDKAISVIKLHGSINWGVDISTPKGQLKGFHIYASYTEDLANDIRSNPESLMQYKELVLTPPVWEKGTTPGQSSNPLSRAWSQAIKTLQTATRVIIIGYSLPHTDAHFRYLMAAGLKDNISLNKIVFINPGLKEGHPSKPILEERIFGVFRKELKEKGVLELLGLDAREFFTNKSYNGLDHEALLNRKFPTRIFASNGMADIRFGARSSLAEIHEDSPTTGPAL